MFYAQSTGGFYSLEIHGDAIPADAVEIDDLIYRSLLDGQAGGMVITASQDGTPVLEAAQTLPQAIADVSPRQIRMALTRAGLRSQVESAVASGNQDLKDWYDHSTTFQRSQPLVAQMGSALGQTPEDLDDLWRLAATL